MYWLHCLNKTFPVYRFSIQQGVGNAKIQTTAPLDYETTKRYEFLVYATDQASDSRRGSATVVVIVNDIQDNIPLFVQTEYEASVNEGSIGLSVLTVRVSVLWVLHCIVISLLDSAVSVYPVHCLCEWVFYQVCTIFVVSLLDSKCCVCLHCSLSLRVSFLSVLHYICCQPTRFCCVCLHCSLSLWVSFLSGLHYICCQPTRF